MSDLKKKRYHERPSITVRRELAHFDRDVSPVKKVHDSSRHGFASVVLAEAVKGDERRPEL